ncbi:MAG: hypothetical protein ABIO70_24730 [Pseudomonadota bacterium]
MARHRLHLVATVILLSGCRSCNWGEDDTALHTGDISVETGAPDDTAGGVDTEDPDLPHGVHGTIEGTVAVTLTALDENGDLVEVPWADSCFGEKFPYGSIFVSALTTDEATGVERYWGSDSIAEPSTIAAANTFSITVDTDEVDEVYLLAVLDKWGDRYISPSDPRGYYAVPVRVHEGDSAAGYEIEILTDYWCGWSSGDGSGGSGWGPCPDCPPGWGDGWGWIWDGDGWVWVGWGWYWDGTQWVWIGGPGSGGGGSWGGGGGGTGSCPYLVTVGGDLIVATPYNGTFADLGTILYQPGDDEPWWIHYDIPVSASGHGAEGTWGYSMCPNAGTYDAQGVWDSNANLLYDPADTWGQAVDADGNAQDSITFGEVDVDQTMLVPVPGAGIDLVPFVRLSGTVDFAEGSFDDLLAAHPGARVAVVAAKYRPNGDFPEEDLEEQYDYAFWTPAQLAGQTSLPFMLLGPAEATLHLWASCDLDGDGIINGPNETFAYYDGGPLTTGTASMSGLDMTLQYW